MVADARKAWQKEIQKRIDDALAEEASSFLPKAQPRVVRNWDEVVIPRDADDVERLTYVPGLVGEATEWMIGCARRPQRMMALGSSLVVVGTIIGRLVMGPTGSATHLLLAILLPSGWGKDAPLKCGAKLVELTLSREALASGQFGSAPGLELDLLKECRRASFADELGDELAVINGQQGNAYVAKIIGTLKKLYNAWDTIITASTVGRESKTILWPAYSIDGAATPEKFYGSLKPGDLESGFINRWLALPHGKSIKPKERKPTNDVDNPPKELQKPLSELEKPVNGEPVYPTRKQVGWGVGAEDVYYKFSAKMDDEPNKQRFELGQRATENAVRLATIVAVGRGSPVVAVEDIEWGIRLAELSLDTLVSDVNKYMVEYLAFPRYCQRVWEGIAARPGKWMSDYKVYRKFGRNQQFGNELQRVLAQLVKEHRLMAQDGRDGSHGKIAPGWLALADEEEDED